MVESYQVKLIPQGQTFEVCSNELILDAAIRLGIDIVYTCRNGTCRTCLVQVLEGIVVQEDPELCSISKQELEMNRRLICMSTVSSDVVIEPKIQRKKKTEMRMDSKI